MRRSFHGILLRWMLLVTLLIAATGAPLLVMAQTATPVASPETAEELGFKLISLSSASIIPPNEDGVIYEVFHTELLIEPGAVVPGTYQHFGTMTIFVLSGAICYMVEDAPAATVSYFTPNPATASAPTVDECASPPEPCTTVCPISPGQWVLLRAGESITHVIPKEVASGNPNGLIHTYSAVGAVPARVVVVEYGEMEKERSCHGGCY